MAWSPQARAAAAAARKAKGGKALRTGGRAAGNWKRSQFRVNAAAAKPHGIGDPAHSDHIESRKARGAAAYLKATRPHQTANFAPQAPPMTSKPPRAPRPGVPPNPGQGVAKPTGPHAFTPAVQPNPPVGMTKRPYTPDATTPVVGYGPASGRSRGTSEAPISRGTNSGKLNSRLSKKKGY